MAEPGPQVEEKTCPFWGMSEYSNACAKEGCGLYSTTAGKCSFPALAEAVEEMVEVLCHFAKCSFPALAEVTEKMVEILCYLSR